MDSVDYMAWLGLRADIPGHLRRLGVSAPSFDMAHPGWCTRVRVVRGVQASGFGISSCPQFPNEPGRARTHANHRQIRACWGILTFGVALAWFVLHCVFVSVCEFSLFGVCLQGGASQPPVSGVATCRVHFKHAVGGIRDCAHRGNTRAPSHMVGRLHC